MFRSCLPLHRVSPYSVFLMKYGSSSKLKGLAFTERAAALSKMYKKVSQNEKADLVQEALRTPAPRRQRVNKAVESDYCAFVRRNFSKIPSKYSPQKRMTKVAELWRNRKV